MRQSSTNQWWFWVTSLSFLTRIISYGTCLMMVESRCFPKSQAILWFRDIFLYRSACFSSRSVFVSRREMVLDLVGFFKNIILKFLFQKYILTVRVRSGPDIFWKAGSRSGTNSSGSTPLVAGLTGQCGHLGFPSTRFFSVWVRSHCTSCFTGESDGSLEALIGVESAVVRPTL